MSTKLRSTFLTLLIATLAIGGGLLVGEPADGGARAGAPASTLAPASFIAWRRPSPRPRRSPRSRPGRKHRSVGSRPARWPSALHAPFTPLPAVGEDAAPRNSRCCKGFRKRALVQAVFHSFLR